MALSRYMDRSTLTFITITAFSCITRLISTAIITRLATTLTEVPTFPLAVTASVFEIFALFTLVAAVGLFLRRVSRSLIMVAWLPGVAFCFVGTLLTLVSLGLTIHYAKENVVRVSVQSNARDLAVAGLTITVLGMFPNAAFYVLIWPHTKQHDTSIEARADRPSPEQSEKHRSMAVHLAALSPAKSNFFKPGSESNVHSHTGRNGPIGASSKSAARQGLQPMSSRTRLLLGASFASRDSRSTHSGADSSAMSAPSRTNSDFENWDTSAVEALDNPFAQRTLLEPIPGSRPASPARPLDGPFGELVGPEETPLPESPIHAPPSDGGTSLRNFRRPSEYDDTYYHPLFRLRPESPAPPLTSPGTVITASPFAGQIVSPDLVAPRILHSAASSRPASPGIPVRSHAGSVKSFRTIPTSPIDRTGALPFETEHLGPSQLSSAH